MLIVAVAFLVMLGGSIMAGSGPAYAIAPTVGIVDGQFDSRALAGLLLVVLSLASIAAPLWALVYRVGTPLVYGAALRTIGAILAVGGLLFAVVLGPVCVYADKYSSDVLSQLVQNEPVYYYLQ